MASVQKDYNINPPSGPPTIIITVQFREMEQSKGEKLRSELETVANRWAKEVLNDDSKFVVDVKIV